MKKTFSAEDLKRVDQLNIEIAERVIEIASISARTLGYKSPVKEVFLEESEDKPVVAGGQKRAEKRNSKRKHRKFHLVEWFVAGARIYFVTSDGCGYHDLETEMCAEAPCT